MPQIEGIPHCISKYLLNKTSLGWIYVKQWWDCPLGSLQNVHFHWRQGEMIGNKACLLVHACMMEESQGKHPFKMAKGMIYYCPCLCIKKEWGFVCYPSSHECSPSIGFRGDRGERKKRSILQLCLFVKGRLSIDGLWVS